jgi:hypothetical protein
MWHSRASTHYELRYKKTKTGENVSPFIISLCVRVLNKQIRITDPLVGVPFSSANPSHKYGYNHMNRRYPQGEERHREIPNRLNCDRTFFPEGKSILPWVHPAGWYCGSARPDGDSKCSIPFCTSRNVEKHPSLTCSTIRQFQQIPLPCP